MTSARQLAVTLALASVATSTLAAAVRLPPAQHDGPVSFVTGGIGDGEARAFERALPHHALAIELLEHAGTREAFTADARVRIADEQGHVVLAEQAQGPFMLVDLPPGRYAIDATLNRQTLHKPVTFVTGAQTARATFEFPSHTD